MPAIFSGHCHPERRTRRPFAFAAEGSCVRLLPAVRLFLAGCYCAGRRLDPHSSLEGQISFGYLALRERARLQSCRNCRKMHGLQPLPLSGENETPNHQSPSPQGDSPSKSREATRGKNQRAALHRCRRRSAATGTCFATVAICLVEQNEHHSPPREDGRTSWGRNQVPSTTLRM
jgi:hypothetical protein